MAGADPIDSLTEKEKEALRLLLAGRDAKASARELGVSHHTINDRLRNARRKLGTTSSRDAAILLNEAEGERPEPIVHKPFGGADSPEAPANRSSTEAEGPDHLGPPWRRKGLIIMSVFAVVAATSLALTLGTGDGGSNGAASASPQAERISVAAEESRSIDEARAFLDLLDTGDARAIYNAAGEELRAVQSFELWELGVALRRSLGDVEKRELIGLGDDESAEKAERGPREIFIFETRFAKGKQVTEYLVMQRIDNEWKPVSYDMDDGNEE